MCRIQISLTKVVFGMVCASLSAWAKPEASRCRALVEDLFAKLFVSEDADIKRIDAILIAETDAVLSRLPEAQRNRILETIRGREILWDFEIAHSGPAGGAVMVAVGLPRLVSLKLKFPAPVLNHPYGRIAFFHEL